MKRTIEKKLRLNKETIVDLSKDQLDSVKGGTFKTAASCLIPPESRCICIRTINNGCPLTE